MPKASHEMQVADRCHEPCGAVWLADGELVFSIEHQLINGIVNGTRSSTSEKAATTQTYHRRRAEDGSIGEQLLSLPCF